MHFHHPIIQASPALSPQEVEYACIRAPLVKNAEMHTDAQGMCIKTLKTHAAGIFASLRSEQIVSQMTELLPTGKQYRAW